MAAPKIEIDNTSMEGIDSVDPISINKELYSRLVRTGVVIENGVTGLKLDEVMASEEKTVKLPNYQTVQYMNGRLFARYLIFLKKHMKHKWNQIWSIKVSTLKEIKNQVDKETRASNWQIIAAELDVSECEE